MEAAIGFEPMIRALQARALPLGYAARNWAVTPESASWRHWGNASASPRQFHRRGRIDAGRWLGAGTAVASFPESELGQRVIDLPNPE